MKLVQIKCESCGAKLNVDEGAAWVSCEYCQTRSKIQPAAALSVRPPLSRSEQASGSSPRNPGEKSKVSVLLPIIAVATIGLVIWLLNGIAFGTKWEGIGRALFVDLNGDGVLDPIGRTRSIGPSDSINVAAFDGKTGDLLWEGERLGSYTESYLGKLSVTQSTILYGSEQGEVWAFAVEDGKERWRVPVGDKVERFCQESEGQAGVLTADERYLRLNLDDGSAGEAAGGECQALEHDRHDGANVEIRRGSVGYDIDGMGVQNAYSRGGDGRLVIGGYARPGTRVPMLAVFNQGTLSWKNELPGVDRLGAAEGPPAKVDSDDEHVAAIFKSKDIHSPGRVALFSMDDGRRLWETSLPSARPISSVQITKHRIYVTTWGRLTAFDPKTGEQVYSIGNSTD